jgi:hypothetical protein
MSLCGSVWQWASFNKLKGHRKAHAGAHSARQQTCRGELCAFSTLAIPRLESEAVSRALEMVLDLVRDDDHVPHTVQDHIRIERMKHERMKILTGKANHMLELRGIELRNFHHAPRELAGSPLDDSERTESKIIRIR